MEGDEEKKMEKLKSNYRNVSLHTNASNCVVLIASQLY